MNNRAFTISFVVAFLAVSMVYSYVTSTEEAYRLQYGTEVSVVVAKKDIKELDILDETNITVKTMPASFKQPGTSQEPKDFIGALAVAPILKDEQVTRSKITQLGVRTGLARQVAIGKRAATVRINDESGVAKLIKPGDRVDVLAFTDPSGTGNKLQVEVRTILQDVMVLATGKYVTNTMPGILENDPMKAELKTKVKLNDYNQFANVTLEVDPFQAQALVFASVQLNGIYLVLRNNDDSAKEDLVKLRMQDLMARDGGLLPAARAPGSTAPPSQAPRP